MCGFLLIGIIAALLSVAACLFSAPQRTEGTVKLPHLSPVSARRRSGQDPAERHFGTGGPSESELLQLTVSSAEGVVGCGVP